MRASWTGVLTFGLVNIPVSLYNGSRDRGTGFHLLHDKDLSPIRLARICRAEGIEVPFKEVVRGFKTGKEDYVVLTEADFERARPRRTKRIAIGECVALSEIDPIYFERPFYLRPARGSERPYALLRNALGKSGRAGIASFVLRDRARLGAVLPEGGFLVLNQLRFADEIVRPRWARSRAASAAGSGLTLMNRLIEEMSNSFDPHRYQDWYAEQVEAVVRGRLKERQSADETQPEPTSPRDLLEALQKSLDKTRRRAA